MTLQEYRVHYNHYCDRIVNDQHQLKLYEDKLSKLTNLMQERKDNDDRMQLQRNEISEAMRKLRIENRTTIRSVRSCRRRIDAELSTVDRYISREIYKNRNPWHIFGYSLPKMMATMCLITVTVMILQSVLSTPTVGSDPASQAGLDAASD